MAEDRGPEDWGEIERLPPARSQAPKVVLLGCGCVLPLILLLTLVGWAWLAADRGRDEERQWQKLEEVLPHDGRPQGYRLEFGFQPGWLDWLFDTEIYIFRPLPRDGAVDPPDRKWVLMRAREDVSALLDTGREGVEPYLPPGSEEPLETVSVQGRELAVALLRQGETSIPFVDDPDPDEPTLVLDLGAPEPWSVLLMIGGKDVDEITPEELRAFLAPFRIGPEHQP